MPHSLVCLYLCNTGLFYFLVYAQKNSLFGVYGSEFCQMHRVMYLNSKKNTGLESGNLGASLALWHMAIVTLGKFLSLSGSQFPIC